VSRNETAVTAQRRGPGGTALGAESPTSRARALGRLLLHPLAAICAVQAALSLSLVWSNTAFTDEAYYLWVGHLEIARLLHGASLPQSYFGRKLSGSPVIYPPLGALADGVGGLAAARILSLGFMLAATVLLYRTTSRLFGRTAAIAGAALWVATEPVIRLAFATYDPMSVSLTALSVWLAVEAAYHERRHAFVLASAASLALSDATAYSGIVMVPVVVVLAFVVWFPRMPTRQAVYFAALATGAWLAVFSVLMAISGSWSGLMDTVLNRVHHNHLGTLAILNWIWSGYGYCIYLVMLLAVVGAVVAVAVEGKLGSLPVVTLACATLVVPAGYVHLHTVTSMDKHLAYGLWLGAIAGGYAVARLIAMPSPRLRPVLVAGCVLALLVPMSNSWNRARAAFHSWANASSFASALKPIVERSNGPILVPTATFRIDHVAEYYTSQPGDWRRWVDVPFSLHPVGLSQHRLESHYVNNLTTGNYRVVILAFYARRNEQWRKVSRYPYPQQSVSTTYNELVQAIRYSPRRGLPYLVYLIRALEADSSYRLMAIGSYDAHFSLHARGSRGLYVIWERASR
jgi:hypothetical protein